MMVVMLMLILVSREVYFDVLLTTFLCIRKHGKNTSHSHLPIVNIFEAQMYIYIYIQAPGSPNDSI